MLYMSRSSKCRNSQNENPNGKAGLTVNWVYFDQLKDSIIKARQ